MKDDRHYHSAPPVSRVRLIVFAGGDFAFNLYWQSAMLYLLFYYTDAVGIRVGTAATIYLIASVWDGLISFVVGAMVDRHWSPGRYRFALVAGAVPLGVTFAMAYASPMVTGAMPIVIVLGGHLLFRTAYALVNIPYLAMSARVSGDSRDRALVAGLRMLAGTAAAVLVALGTVPLGSAVMGVSGGSRAFLGAALLFGVLASVILIVVGATFRDALMERASPPPQTVFASLIAVGRNRAFTTLAAAMMAMIVATSALDKSVLYYFKYELHDEAGGRLALASMMAVSAAAVPVWMVIARGMGVRGVWFAAVTSCALGLTAFVFADPPGAGAMRLFLVLIHAATVGLHFAFWAMLPDTIDWGERTTGMRVEGTVFGLAALLQRVAIGVATAMLGWSFGQAGYVANAAQNAQALATMRTTIAVVPLGFFLVAGLLMVLNPLRRARD